MTKQEAYNIIKKETDKKTGMMYGIDVIQLINQLYNDFEKQQKRKRYKIPMRKEKLN